MPDSALGAGAHRCLFQSLAKNATSAVQSEAYTGANMPAGFTASALVAVLPTNANGQFAAAILQDRTVEYFKSIYSGNPGAVFTPVGISSCVPLNAKKINTNVAITSTGTAGATSAAICATANGIGTPGYSVFSSYVPASATIVSGSFHDVSVFAQQLYIATSGPVNTATINYYGNAF